MIASSLLTTTLTRSSKPKLIPGSLPRTYWQAPGSRAWGGRGGKEKEKKGNRLLV